MTIVLQIQHNHQYSATPISIENLYNTAYNNYVAQNNSIANSYTNTMNSYNQASTAISQANQFIVVIYYIIIMYIFTQLIQAFDKKYSAKLQIPSMRLSKHQRTKKNTIMK